MNPEITCIVVDDEPLAIQLLESHINQIPGLVCIASCQNALKAFEIISNHKVDLIFLDIQMPMITGLEFVRSLSDPPAIIFTTAYRDYAVESYELNVIDYLLKPITFTRFFKAYNKFISTKEKNHQISSQSLEKEHLFVNSNKKHIKIAFEDILYVESLKDYIKIHTVNDRIVTKEKISDFVLKLPESFIRVHRSYIVNISKITAYTAHDIEITKYEIPIGISYKNEVLKRLG